MRDIHCRFIFSMTALLWIDTEPSASAASFPDEDVSPFFAFREVEGDETISTAEDEPDDDVPLFLTRLFIDEAAATIECGYIKMCENERYMKKLNHK